MRVLGSVDTKLNEDDHIFDHCSQGTNQPWKVDEEVFLLCGMAEDLYPLLAIVFSGVGTNLG